MITPSFSSLSVRKLICCLFLLSISLSAFAELKWTLVKDEEGIQVYSQPSTDSLLTTTKGVTVIPASLNHLLTVLGDPKTFPRWMFNSKSAKTLKQINIVERLDYIVTDMPLFAWDRDLIVRSVFQQNRETEQVQITFTPEPDFIPEKQGVVRIRNMAGRITLTPQGDDKVHMVYEVSADPEGKLPKWLVNSVAQDFPFYSLKNLREAIINGL